MLIFCESTISRVTGTPHLLVGRQVVHQIQHQVFEDHAQSARAHLALQRQAAIASRASSREPQSHIFVFEQPLVLLDDRVLRLCQDLDQRGLVRSSSTATTGIRPMNSGMKPYLIRSSGWTLFEQIDIAAAADRPRRRSCFGVFGLR